MGECSEELTLGFNEQAYDVEKDKERAARGWEDREARRRAKTLHRILESSSENPLTSLSCNTDFSLSQQEFDTC